MTFNDYYADTVSDQKAHTASCSENGQPGLCSLFGSALCQLKGKKVSFVSMVGKCYSLAVLPALNKLAVFPLKVLGVVK